MTDRPQQQIDAELDRSLAELGERLVYPPTPDLAGSLRRRPIDRSPRPPYRAGWLPLRQGLAAGLLALLLLIAAGLAVSPGARTVVADRLGLRGVVITYVPVVPTPTVAPVGTSLGLGTSLSLAEAQARVPYRLLRPTLPDLQTPDEMYVGEPPQGGQVAFVYRVRPGLPETATTGVGLLLTQFEGSVDANLFGKGLGPGTHLEQVVVSGRPGFWIEGKPHLFFYRDAAGQLQNERGRRAGNTLLWEQEGLTLRLEAALAKEEALRIAASVQ